jgi:hypothetical protein
VAGHPRQGSTVISPILAQEPQFAIIAELASHDFAWEEVLVWVLGC